MFVWARISAKFLHLKRCPQEKGIQAWLETKIGKILAFEKFMSLNVLLFPPPNKTVLICAKDCLSLFKSPPTSLPLTKKKFFLCTSLFETTMLFYITNVIKLDGD